MSLFKPTQKSLSILSFALLCNIGMMASAQAGTALDLSFSSDTVKFGVYQKENSGEKLQNYGVDYLYNSKKGGMLSGVGEIIGFQSAPNLDAGLKGKVYYMKTNAALNKNGYGIMLGAIVRYWLPTEVPASVSADYSIGPNILTGGDVDSNTELNLKASVQVVPGTSAYFGYRKQQFTLNNTNNSTFTLDDSYHIGVSFTFN
jgi:hypothetical protein